MISRRIALSGLLVLPACGGSASREASSIPDLGTPWVVFGSAALGRAALPATITVRPADETRDIAPAPIAGGQVDMFLAGFEPNDFPRVLRPDDLTFLAERAPNWHRLFPLRAAHVLARPIEPGAAFALSPVEAPGLPSSVTTERKRRLEQLTERLGIRDPCIEPVVPFQVLVPRTSGEEILSMRTLSNGKTILGLTATGTAIIGAFDHAQPDTIEVIGVRTAPMQLGRSDRVKILDLGDREVVDRRGRVLPRALTVHYAGGFGGTTGLLTYDETRGAYTDETPFSVGAPATLAGVRTVELDGTASTCAFGLESGPNRVASIYCRTQTSTTWSPPARFRESYGITTVVPRRAGSPLAFDHIGTVYAWRNRRWTDITRAVINDGCSPPCAILDAWAPATDTGDIVGVWAGSDAQVLLVRTGPGGSVTLEGIEGLSAALFADERFGGDHALRIATIAMSPDGAIWIGSEDSILIRIAPDHASTSRICIPPELRASHITAIEALEDGTLILGISPTSLGLGRWR